MTMSAEGDDDDDDEDDIEEKEVGSGGEIVTWDPGIKSTSMAECQRPVPPSL